jgi:hypothetical protein
VGGERRRQLTMKLPLGLELRRAGWPLRRRLLVFLWIVFLLLLVGAFEHQFFGDSGF